MSWYEFTIHVSLFLIERMSTVLVLPQHMKGHRKACAQGIYTCKTRHSIMCHDFLEDTLYVVFHFFRISMIVSHYTERYGGRHFCEVIDRCFVQTLLLV
jgi:hypothetical protein